MIDFLRKQNRVVALHFRLFGDGRQVKHVLYYLGNVYVFAVHQRGSVQSVNFADFSVRQAWKECAYGRACCQFELMQTSSVSFVVGCRKCDESGNPLVCLRALC